MKNILTILFMLTALFAATSCHEQPEYSNDPYGNFDALWTIIDEHYCFFKYKDIDWKEVGQRYRAELRPNMTSRELFAVCAAMCNELKDGHTNLISSFDVSFYREFFDKYPQNYNQRVVEQNYLNYNFKSSCGIHYQILTNNFGYMYYGSFSNTIGEGNLDAILNDLMACDGLVIDVRDNGGGILLNVETLISRFINQPIFAGAVAHKTGPGHNDFSEPYKYYFYPSADGHTRFLKPVVVLTNRSSYSATNNFVSIMQYLPQVKIVGDKTGGGSGLPFSGELPNGWSIRFSACSVTDPAGKITEYGVDPSEGYHVDITPEDMAAGRDPILEAGFKALQEMIKAGATAN